MPQPNSIFLESLASRYNPVNSPDWQPLIQHFELGQGFAFIVLLVPNDDWAEVCREALDSFLRARGEHIMQIPISAPSDLQNLAGTLLDMRAESGAGAIWVARAVPEALPDYQVWFKAWRQGVAWLNQHRNPLRRQFEIPVIFVGAPWLQVVLRENAPDLWSVRTLVVRVKPDATEAGFERRIPSPDRAGPSRGPDPELALAEANRLRSKEGTDLAVARLLHRAGVGFMARYERQTAVQAFSEALDLRLRAGAQPREVADTRSQLGVALIRVADYDHAVSMLAQARSEYEKEGDALKTAQCVWSIGDIAMRRSDYPTARLRFEEALPLFRSVGDAAGEALCNLRLGIVALENSDLKTAEARFDEALTLYCRIGDRLGQANSILRLGQTALQNLDHETACARYEEALRLFRTIGDMFGVANCLMKLGEIALDRFALESARLQFTEAQQLYRDVGDVLGEANCIVGLGDVERAQGNMSAAREHYRAALPLYRQIESLYSVARVYRSMAGVSEGEERDGYVAAARDVLQSINRQDLIAALDREFTPPTPPAVSPK